MRTYKVRVRVIQGVATEDYFVDAENERDARATAENYAADEYPHAVEIEAIRSRIAEDGE